MCGKQRIFKSPYVNDGTMSRVDDIGFDFEDLVQGIHVVEKVFENGRSFP